MDIDLAALPDDVETLQRLVRTLASDRAALSEAQAEIERLRIIVQKLQRSQFGRRSERLDADQLQFGFEDLEADLARQGVTIEIVKRTDQDGGFKVVRRRWVVERTFSWLRRNRRLTAHYEALALIAEGFAKLVMINLMLKRLTETKPKPIS